MQKNKTEEQSILVKQKRENLFGKERKSYHWESESRNNKLNLLELLKEMEK
jgi:hypothetical protein